MSDIKELREKIDGIDRELQRLFEERMAVSKAVGEYKKERGLPVYDAKREREVIAARVARTADKSLVPYVESFFVDVMNLSKDAQKDDLRPKLAENDDVTYQGVEGAYGHEAAMAATKGKTVGVPAFEDVFLSVVNGKSRYGIIPVENSYAGSVTENYDLLGKYDVHICGEVILPIDHVLMGIKGAQAGGIRQIYSHPQGLAQCADFFAGHSEIEAVPYGNTAASAKLVKERGDASVAAIASRHAARVYGLDILMEDISNSRNSNTRFFLIGNEEGEAGNRATAMFVVNDRPGALVDVLDVIRSASVNLTKIESRPMRGRNWEYMFFADMEGDESAIRSIGGMVKNATVIYRLLGIYGVLQKERV